MPFRDGRDDRLYGTVHISQYNPCQHTVSNVSRKTVPLLISRECQQEGIQTECEARMALFWQENGKFPKDCTSI